MTASGLQPTAIDVSACEREPIHVPGSIQPHGVLLALRGGDLRLAQVSANIAELTGRTPDQVLNHPLSEVIGAPAAKRVTRAARARDLSSGPLYLGTLRVGPDGVPVSAVAHRSGATLMLELERTESAGQVAFQDLYELVRSFLKDLEGAGSTADLSALAAREVRRITGFDRVLVYQFDAEWNGRVIAEDRSEVFSSYLDLWFPASDIPHQARELYRLNRWRLIADASYQPVPIVPAIDPESGAPIDLSFAALRSVSPVHLEYLRNMGVTSSMSISVVCQDRLWGLISCHHATPRTLPFQVRTACDFLGQVFSLQLVSRENTAEHEQRGRIRVFHNRLLASMAAHDPFIEGLTAESADLLAMAAAEGAAVLFEGQCTLVGRTPSEPLVQRLVDWLLAHGRKHVFATDRLPSLLPDGEEYRSLASGLLAVSVSATHRSYVLWFRPEVIQTVTWGGDPRKPVRADGERLNPRTSFQAWKETVRGRSLPWRPSELEAAADLRSAIVGVVLRKAEELADLSAELQESNAELEAFSYSVSHDLRAPFRHIVGYAEMLRERLGDQADPTASRYLETIVHSAHFAGTLVDNLLTFSQIGRSSLQLSPVELDRLVAEVRDEAAREAAGRRIEWRIAPLPRVSADLILLRQALRNLVSNAVKYTGTRDPAVIEISSRLQEGELVVAIRDNGVGFDMQYVDKLFGVFQRLHRLEEFEGTGIGLANVRRIISRHGGRTWAEGEIDKGATFYFTLPHHAAAEAI